MKVQRASLKLFFEDTSSVAADSWVPRFHRFLRDRSLPGSWIDVADYRHVPGGPGVVLVGHAADYRADERGLTFVRKARFGEPELDPEASLRELLRGAAAGASVLREEGIALRTDRLDLRVEDRLRAPNRPETLEAWRAVAIRAWAEALRPGRLTVEPAPRDPRAGVALRASAPGAPEAAILAERLDPPRPVVRIPAPQSRQLERWAREGYPHEVCGLLVGKARGSVVEVAHVARARNLERDRAADRFVLDPGDFVRVDAEARRAGREIVGIWHTHPDHPARPSATDLASAWEGYSYVIASVGRDAVDNVTSWRIANGTFIEESIEEAAG